jgi:hypothetical protein
MTIDTMRLRSMPGDGVLIREGGAVGFARGRDVAGTSSALLETVRVAGEDGPTSSNAFAAAPADEVTAACVVVAAQGRWRLGVFGDIDVEVCQPGSSMVVSGRQSASWIVREFVGPVSEVHVRADVESVAASDLVVGVVAAGGFSLGPDETDLVRDRAAASLRPPGVRPEPGSPTGETPEVGPPVAPPREPSVALDELPEIPIPERRGAPAPAGYAVFDDSSAYYLDSDYIVGRQPQGDPAVVQGDARALVIDDTLISRVHCVLQVRDGQLLVLDRGSSNGTFLWNEEQAVWAPLRPGEATAMAPHARVGLGKRYFTFEPATS